MANLVIFVCYDVVWSSRVPPSRVYPVWQETLVNMCNDINELLRSMQPAAPLMEVKPADPAKFDNARVNSMSREEWIQAWHGRFLVCESRSNHN